MTPSRDGAMAEPQATPISVGVPCAKGGKRRRERGMERVEQRAVKIRKGGAILRWPSDAGRRRRRRVVRAVLKVVGWRRWWENRLREDKPSAVRAALVPCEAGSVGW